MQLRPIPPHPAPVCRVRSFLDVAEIYSSFPPESDLTKYRCVQQNLLFFAGPHSSFPTKSSQLLSAKFFVLFFAELLLSSFPAPESTMFSKKHGLQQPREVDDQASYPMSMSSMSMNYTQSLAATGGGGGGGGSSLSPRSSSENDTSAEPAGSVIRRVQDKYATVALTMAFLLYSTVSTVIFQVFCACCTPRSGILARGVSSRLSRVG